MLALIFIQRDEPIPTMASTIHLLVLLYTSVKDMPEFHRQVIAPTLQKFSIALLQLVEKPESPRGLKACEWTLVEFTMCDYLTVFSVDSYHAVPLCVNPRASDFAHCIAKSTS
jgi:rRNA processing/ribosome biogenesis